jgi:hypothetical protein
MKQINKVVVIGSGPSAIACCIALVENGFSPLVLDIGSTQDHSLSKILPNDQHKVPKKYKNNYMYSSFDSGLSNSFLLESIGYGGFSTVWGGVISKPVEAQLDGWPIGLSDLESSFEEIDKLFLHKGVNDDFSVFRKLPKPDIYFNSFGESTINIGAPRMAYSKSNPEKIFSTDEIFSQLVKDELIFYKSGIRVLKIIKKNNLLAIYSHDEQVFLAKKVFLAAGAPQSTLIVARSLVSNVLTLKISETKLLITFWLSIFLKKKKTNGIPKICYSSEENQCYLQIYDFKESYLQSAFNFPHLLLNRLASKIASLITFSFAYIYQIQSGALFLKKEGEKIIFTELEPININSSIFKVKNISKQIIKTAVHIGSRVKKFGFGYHVGASLPMSLDPGEYETDIWGSLKEIPGLHIIDGSVLPTLPSMPLTYLIMANSMRITKGVISNEVDN